MFTFFNKFNHFSLFNNLSFHTHFIFCMIFNVYSTLFSGQTITKVFPSSFKQIMFLAGFFHFPSCFSMLLFHGRGLLYKFCRWPQESPSSNPNPKPLYRSWPALQISFKHLRLTFLSSSWMFQQTFHFWLLKISRIYLDTTNILFMHGVVRGGPWVQFHPRMICIYCSEN